MEITGTVVSVIFQSADGYAVVEISGDKPTTVVGVMPHIKVGALRRFEGEFRTHPRYGDQFVCERCESMEPESPEAMAAYLASDFVKGIGPVLAKRIVDAFGADTFRVIEEEPERLRGIPGLSRKVAASLHERFAEESRDQHRYADLLSIGLTARQAVAAEKAFGSEAAAAIRANPYILAGNVRGFDFLRADAVAQRLGIGEDSPFRLRTAILHVLRKSQRERGHMRVPQEMLLGTVCKALDARRDQAEKALLALALGKDEDGDMLADGVVLRRPSQAGPTFVYLRGAAEAEEEISRRLMDLKHGDPVCRKDTDVRIPRKTRDGVELSEEQRGALRTAWENPVCIITGGPGTGKTTIIRAALDMYGRQGLSCAMAAPTGRAAKRMEQTTGQQSQTIHRLLEYGPSEEDAEFSFQKNEDEPLKADVVIVDEMSMVDAHLFRALLRGIPKGARLLMIGDADQLPSVGAGNVLRDLISSGCIATVALSHRYRNAGPIAAGAMEILQGRMPEFDAHEFVFMERRTADEVHDLIRRLYMRALSQGQDVQVLVPVKQNTLGPLLGSIDMNNMLRDAVNPPTDDKAELIFSQRLFREGDRVMQIVNDYQREWSNPATMEKGTGVFNGDVGFISSIAARAVRVQFDDGRCATYEEDELDSLDSAFAYTIHKSQGNEFETVIMPMTYISCDFLSRSLLYTAVTRAKKRIVLVGSKSSMRSMIANDKRGDRYTGLVDELRLQERTLADGMARGSAV